MVLDLESHETESAEVDSPGRMEEITQQKPWIINIYNERKIPKKFEDIRKLRQMLLKESKIIELTGKFQFEKYAFSRLTDNLVFDHIRNYLAAFYINSFRNFEGKSKVYDEIWMRNEGLPFGKGLFELYLWFCNERGYGWDMAIEDLKILGGHMRNQKEEQFFKERMRRNVETGKSM